MAKQTVFGPYRVKNIGVGGDVWEVVEMADNATNTYSELRPRRTYTGKPNSRETAYQAMVRLNRNWQRDHAMEDDILERWHSATN